MIDGWKLVHNLRGANLEGADLRDARNDPGGGRR